MLKERLFAAIEQVYEKIRNTQTGNIAAAAEVMASSVKNGGCIHLFDTGHIIDSEMFNRAGGLVLMRRFRYGLTLESSMRKREIQNEHALEGLAAIALRQAGVQAGDVMVIGSVSGKTINVIDLALACREIGVKVIGVTSVTYSEQLPPVHSCGKKLYELADVVLDNCAPFGDALLQVEGVEAPCFPASGLAAAYLMWAVNAALTERLLQAGITPSVLKSVNYPPNVEFNNQLYQRYDETGY